MRRVIVNSTPLIALCNADLLNILKEIYGSQVTFGDGDKGVIINANTLKLAKSVAEDGKNLTELFKSYNNVKTSDNKKFYENQIRKYIAEAKMKNK